MKKILIPAFSFFSLLILLSACNKDEDSPSKTDLLTAKKWSISKIEVKAPGTTTNIDVTKEFSEACESDDITIFYKDGKIENKTGTSKCDSDDIDETGTWAWKENETKISTTIDGDTSEVTVVELTSGTLKVKSNDPSLIGELTITFVGK